MKNTNPIPALAAISSAWQLSNLGLRVERRGDSYILVGTNSLSDLGSVSSIGSLTNAYLAAGKMLNSKKNIYKRGELAQ